MSACVYQMISSLQIMTMLPLCLFVLLLRLPVELDGCGVSTHISIANQALQSFADDAKYNVSYRQIIVDNLDAFYAGANYPDAMYPSLCFNGRFHQVAEDTHWVPFLNASVHYITNTFPKPWNEATRKLVAFILGVVSHQVADVSWHSLGIDQGFLQTMAKMNFHGSFATAHPIGDVGGDMVSMYEGDLSGVLPLNGWYVPVGDLMNIYKKLYNNKVTISEEVIRLCSKVLYMEGIGESLVGANLFSMYARKSTFLVEELHSYYLGGKSDMAAWTSNIWKEVMYMFEIGTNKCSLPRNPLYVRCLSKQNTVTYGSKERSLRNGRRTSLMYVKDVDKGDIVEKEMLRGVYFATNGVTADRLMMKKRKLKLKKLSERAGEPLTMITKNKFAQLGWSLVTDELSLFGHVLITGAPWYGNPGNSQHGRVYVLAGKQTYSHLADVDEVANLVLDGENENSRFGFALAVLDFNQDGINDLAVSAPSEGSNELNYTGKVYIYYGNTKSGLDRSPDTIIQGDEHYYNLGTTLLAADVNHDGYKDLIIGSKYAPMSGEQRGSVAVFFSSKKRSQSRPTYYFANQSDWLLPGGQNYSWFGSAVTFHNHTSIGPLLLVSAPTYRICALKNCSYSQNDTQSVGVVYGYRWSSNSTSRLLFEVVGKYSQSKLGNSIAIGDPFADGEMDVLAVSLPTADVQGRLPLNVPITFEHAGQVYLLSLKTLAYNKGMVLPGSTDYITRFEGNRNFGRFGWHLSWQDVNQDGTKDLVIGSPYHTQDIEENNGGEQGVVHVFYGGIFFPRGDVTSDCSLLKVVPCPQDVASLSFKANQKFGQFGRSVIVMKTFSNATSLIVSAPRQTSNSTSMHNGAIVVIQPTSNKIDKIPV